MELGRVGVWTFALDRLPLAQAGEVLAELEQLGYGALWIPEAVGRDPFVSATALSAATERIVIATGIASIHARTAHAAQSAWKSVTEFAPERFVLGLGVSHQPMVEGMHHHAYERPYATMVEYLDQMDAGLYLAAEPTTPPRRMLAALGPRMLRLAAQRSLGAHPYFVPPEHTAMARAELGHGPLLAPEQAVVLETDPAAARRLAIEHMALYLGLPNYVNNLRRLGFTEQDVSTPSARLIDAIVAWGSEDDIRRRVLAHFAAGADHVALQVITPADAGTPVAQWRRLADALADLRAGSPDAADPVEAIDAWLRARSAAPASGEARAAIGGALRGTVHLHCTDAHGEWMIADADGGGLTVTREHAKGDVAVRGPAAVVLAALRDPHHARTGLEVFGDVSVFDALVGTASRG